MHSKRDVGSSAQALTAFCVFSMAESHQGLLQEAWLGGRTGNLSAWSEAKLWGAREVWRVQNDAEYGLQTFAAGLVKKKHCTNEHPSQPAVRKLYEKVDA